MPYFYEEPGRFKMLLVDHDPDLGRVRLTVDTPEDLTLVRKIYDAFGNSDRFSLREILELLDRNPGWQTLNASVAHKGYLDIDQRD